MSLGEIFILYFIFYNYIVIKLKKKFYNNNIIGNI